MEKRDGHARGDAQALAIATMVGLAAALLLAWLPEAASAAGVRPAEGTFGALNQPTFAEAAGVAVDPASGDLLVIDLGDQSVSRWTPEGQPAEFSALGTNVIDGAAGPDATPQGEILSTEAKALSAPWGPVESEVAVAPPGSAGGTAGDIYVTDALNEFIDIFAPTGAYLGQVHFGYSCGVAVASGGDVYIGDFDGEVHKLVPTAPTSFGNPANFPFAEACQVAANGEAVFAAHFEGEVAKLDATTGAEDYVVSGGNNTTVSVDPTTERALVATGSEALEFDTSGATGATQTAAIAAGSQVLGVAAGGAEDRLYLSSRGTATISMFGELEVLPSAVSKPAAPIGTESATLNGTVNPEGVEVEECEFEYGTTASYGTVVPCAESSAEIGSGNSPLPVHAEIAGLEPLTEYHFRLVARNAAGESTGADQTFITHDVPVVGGESTGSVGSTEAVVTASVDPAGLQTAFFVEYGTTAAYGQVTPMQNVGFDYTDHTITAALTGLSPETSYHWRVVAVNAVGRGEGSDATFTTGPSATAGGCPNEALRQAASSRLPDCRAYEMVSPVEKSGGGATGVPGFEGLIAGFEEAAAQAPAVGPGLTYSSYQAFGGAPSAPYASQYLATRGNDGWTDRPLSPPRGLTIPVGGFPILVSEFKQFSPELATAWVWHNSDPLSAGAPAGFTDIYRRDTATDAYIALNTTAPPTTSPVDFFPEFQGSSADGRKAIFRVADRLTPNAPPLTSSQTQLYEWTAGEGLRLVSILPGAPEEPATEASSAGTANTSVKLGYQQTVASAISADGSHIYWSTEPSHRLYLRIDGSHTLPVSETVSGEPAQFWAANSAGTEALFTIGTELGSTGSDLYRFDATTDEAALVAHTVKGVLGASETLDYVYFVSTEDLAEGATAGKSNLYVDHDGTVGFIAAVSESEATAVRNGGSVPSVDNVVPIDRTSTVTPNGQALAFMSAEPLTGFDNTDRNSGKPDAEIFVYDAASGSLTCASCNSSHRRPTGRLVFEDATGQIWAAASLPSWENELYDPRSLSADGNRLIFDSFDSLTPQDQNRAEDVYEWETAGTGSCVTAGGCISLLSSGESPQDSEFVDASASGDDAFIRTWSSLLPQDSGEADIYDARVDGGFPTPASPVPCSGEACQSASAAQAGASPGTANFSGPGNVKAPKKHHKKKHHKKRHHHKRKAGRAHRKGQGR